MRPGFSVGLLIFTFTIAGIFLVHGQTHQHAQPAAEEGRFNPFVVSDNEKGFYFAYIERTGRASNVMLRRSSDGVVFSKPVRVNNLDGDATVRNENPPKVAVGRNGEVYVVWASESSRWKGNIRFARSIDGGKTFSPAISINSDAGNEPAGHAFQSIAVDKDGRIHVVWIDERNKKSTDRGGEIWISTSEDDGRMFSPDRKILGDVCECCRPTIVSDPSGRLYISYRTVPPTGPMYRDIIVARSDDQGKTFTKFAVSRDGWDIQACPIAGPALVVDGTGRLTVVWFTAGSNRPRMLFSTSTDAGVTFSPGRLLDPRQTLAKHAHAVPWLNGHVVVAWDDVDGQANDPTASWGILDSTNGDLKKLGTQRGCSYPVIAAGNRSLTVVAIQPADRTLFQKSEEVGPRK